MTVSDPIRTVIWGQPGVGKTTLASKFPNPWFIDVEKSTAWMPELRARQWERPKTWDDILNQIRRFKSELPGETLVIDSIDWMEARYIEKFGAPGGQNDYGQSYNAMDKTFRKILDELTEISEKGAHVVLTAHFDTKEVSDPDQMGSYSKYVLKMQKKTCSAVMEWADQVLFLRFRDTVVDTDKKGKRGKAVGGQIRDIKTVRAAAYDAKNRFELPEVIEFKADKTMPEPLRTLLHDGFDAYLALQQGGVPAQSVQPVQPAQSVPPVVQPVIQPVQPQRPVEPVQPVQTLQPSAPTIDPTLQTLMDRDHITVQDIEKIVDEKHFFPQRLSIYEYPQDFVQSMIIAGWEQMKGAINKSKEITIDSDDLPF